MSLPFVLDLIIGLIFIYLILSLLASEIQELLTTLFQWRAKHLKESIENLLAGGGTQGQEVETVKKLVNSLYDDPLLKNINQEARGSIGKAFRQVTWFFSRFYRRMRKKHNGTFGDKHSGPSYISSETFATTLLETLKLSDLIENLIQLRFDHFKDRVLNEIKAIAEKIGESITQDERFIEFTNELTDEFNEIAQEFSSNQATLKTSVDKLSEGLERYIQAYPPDEDLWKKFRDRLQAYKQNIFGNQNERAILAGGLQPSLSEIIDAVDTDSPIHKQIKAAMVVKDSAGYQEILKMLDHLPISVKESLKILARRAETRVKKTENDINQLREEISIWFDRSMERSSGVYKRNAKGVAILIGFFLAVATNADTFHLFHRLSSDENLRKIVTERATQISQNPTNPDEIRPALEKIKEQTDQVLKDIALPLTWTPANLKQQFNCPIPVESAPQNTTPDQDWDKLFNQCIPNRKPSARAFIPEQVAELMLKHPWQTLKMMMGWLLSGIAISMGAPFWFDLLGKVVNVRNSGKRPPTSANQANPK